MLIYSQFLRIFKHLRASAEANYAEDNLIEFLLPRVKRGKQLENQGEKSSAGFLLEDKRGEQRTSGAPSSESSAYPRNTSGSPLVTVPVNLGSK